MSPLDTLIRKLRELARHPEMVNDPSANLVFNADTGLYSTDCKALIDEITQLMFDALYREFGSIMKDELMKLHAAGWPCEMEPHPGQIGHHIVVIQTPVGYIENV